MEKKIFFSETYKYERNLKTKQRTSLELELSVSPFPWGLRAGNPQEEEETHMWRMKNTQL